MALMAEAGPVTQSPPAKMPSMSALASLLSLRASMVPRWMGMPACSKALVSMPWPMATTTMSAGMRTSGRSAALGTGRPERMSPGIWGWTHRATAWPFSSASMRTGAIRVRSSTPSATAPSTSSGRAVMSAWRRR